MIDPTRHRQLQELDVVGLCTRILQNSRNELYLNMRYLDLSLSSLGFEMDPGPAGGWEQMALLFIITGNTSVICTGEAGCL